MSATAIVIGKPFSVPRLSGLKIVLSWMVVTLLAFPLAGFLGWAVGGHVDGVMPAVIGEALTPAGVGLLQWLFLRRDLGMGPVWIVATAVALAVGLSVGAAAVGYETTAGSLAITGAVSVVVRLLGIAQGLLLRSKFSRGTCGCWRCRQCLRLAGV